MGGLGGTIFASLAAGFFGSLVAQQFLDAVGDFGFDEGDTSEQAGDEGPYGDAGGDYGSGDYGGGDFGGGDFGGGF